MSEPKKGGPPPLPVRVMPYQSQAVPIADDTAVQRWMIPVGRSGWSIAAGYAGLFSIVGCGAPFAVVFGILALRELKRHPELGGRGRAWFGLIAGALGTAAIIAITGVMLLSP